MIKLIWEIWLFVHSTRRYYWKDAHLRKERDKEVYLSQAALFCKCEMLWAELENESLNKPDKRIALLNCRRILLFCLRGQIFQQKWAVHTLGQNSREYSPVLVANLKSSSRQFQRKEQPGKDLLNLFMQILFSFSLKLGLLWTTY